MLRRATINQKDGMVRILEDPEQYKGGDVVECIDSSIQRIMTPPKKLTPCSISKPLENTMEQLLLIEFKQIVNQSSDGSLNLQALTLARSIMLNHSTSERTTATLFNTLTVSLQPSSSASSLHHTLSLISDLSIHWPNFAPDIFTAIHSFCLLPNASTRTVADSFSLLLSLAEHNQTLVPSLAEVSEGLFISLCFCPYLLVRLWMLRNADRLYVTPSLLVTILLGFTKDPYPYVRRTALDRLVGLCKYTVVEDYSLIEGCYFRAVELLFDMEDSVRCSAVRAVTEWGQMLVAFNLEECKGQWSNALFVQLCSMVRDMSVEVRVEAFDALGKLGMVSEDILMQTLSKSVLPMIKGKEYPGQFTAKQLKLLASNSAGAFVQGLEDEFDGVRRSACHSLRTLSALSTDFASGALNLLMDVLNDDSLAVRLQALETMHHMTVCDCLRVQETHMHMFLGALVDSNPLIRSAARKILRLTKLHNLTMVKLSLDGLVENLEIYPQDEADAFSVLFYIGLNHGNFAVSIIQEVIHEIEPSSEGKLSFDCARVAALLVLAISTPLSHEQYICNIPPRIFSYAVTLLGRISYGLADVMDQNTLLAYLLYCSRSTIISASEFFKVEGRVLPVIGDDLSNYTSQISKPVWIHMQQNDGAAVTHAQRTEEWRKVANPLVDCQQEMHDELTQRMKLILDMVKDIWSLVRYGCMDEVLTILRSWKEELATFHFASGLLAFTLQYLQVVKLLGKVWVHYMSPRKLYCFQKDEFSVILEKLDRNLREMRFRFIGMSKEMELHVLELMLVTCTLKLSNVEASYHHSILEKLYSTISHLDFLHEEGFIEPSNFVIELKKSVHKLRTSIDDAAYRRFLFQKSLEYFYLKQIVFCGELEHMKAELEVPGNDFESPIPFISGLPAGIPFEITLYNISSWNRMWLKLVVDLHMTEFIFLDLEQLGGSDKITKFTYTAPFYKTPNVKFFDLKACIGMECLSEDVHVVKGCRGPKHELVYLCKEKEVYLSMDHMQ